MLLFSYVFFGSWGRVRAWLSLSASQIGTGAGDVGEHRSEAFPGKLLGKTFFYFPGCKLEVCELCRPGRVHKKSVASQKWLKIPQKQRGQVITDVS